MSSSLIKLLIEIEKNAAESPKIYSSRAIPEKKTSHKLHMYEDPKNPKKSHEELIEKRKRRTLRSKITKILSNLPNVCNKINQQKSNQKWTEHTKNIYDISKEYINQVSIKKSSSPVNQINVSYENDDFEFLEISPKRALLNSLTEDELALLSEDPLYFLHDKKILKLDIPNNWDKLILNDPKNPKNIKKGIKIPVDIDFVKDIRIKKRPKKSSNPIINQLKVPDETIKSNNKIFTLRKSPKLSGSSEIMSTYHTHNKTFNFSENKPKLPSIAQKTINTPVQSQKVLSQDSKELKNFLKASESFEKKRKNHIITTAKESKLIGVKSLLKQWEEKKK
jgi:hypothetical protein